MSDATCTCDLVFGGESCNICNPPKSEAELTAIEEKREAAAKAEAKKQSDRALWEAEGKSLAGNDDDIKWKMGEWLVSGLRFHAEERESVERGLTLPSVYDVATDLTGLARDTLKDRASVWRRAACVRTHGLTWSHHRHLVNAMPDATDEELKNKLADALERGISANAFKAELDQFKKPMDWKSPDGKPKNLERSFVVTVPLWVFEQLTRISILNCI